MSAVSADNHSPAEAEVHQQQSSSSAPQPKLSTDNLAKMTASTDNQKPSSDTQSVGAVNGGSTSSNSHSSSSCSKADVSSEDIDVMSTPQRGEVLNGGGEDVKPDLHDSPTRHIVGINSAVPVTSNGMLVRNSSAATSNNSKSDNNSNAMLRDQPEADLPARLKRFKTVVLGALFKHSKSLPFRLVVLLFLHHRFVIF